MIEVRKYEEEVEREQEDVETQPALAPEETITGGVPTSTRWIKARVRMIMAQVLKRYVMNWTYTEDERAIIEDDLYMLEEKLSMEPDTPEKADISGDIEKIRELLLHHLH